MATETIDRAALAAEAARRMQELAGGTVDIPSLGADPLLVKYQDALAALRKDGVNKILTLNQTIGAAKKNKMLGAAERSRIIADCSSQIAQAKEVAARNASADRELTKDALAYANVLARQYIAQVDAEQDKRLPGSGTTTGSRSPRYRQTHRSGSLPPPAMRRKPPATSSSPPSLTQRTVWKENLPAARTQRSRPSWITCRRTVRCATAARTSPKTCR